MKLEKLLFCVFFLLVLLLISSLPVYAVSFGTNKVITESPRWFITQSPHFEIYHTEELSLIIPDISSILENTYLYITKLLDYELEEKIPFFIYSTHNTFEQNNIANIGEGTGGFAEAFKNRFVIPLTGSEKWLRTVIQHEFTHIVTFEILYGGFWKSARLVKSYFYPLWFMEGLAEYGTNEWGTDADMLVREAALTGNLIPISRLQSFNHLKGHQIVLAYKLSHNFITFLVEKYGGEVIPRLAIEFKDRLNPSSALEALTKKDIFQINDEWFEFLKDKYTKQAEGTYLPDKYGRRLTADSEYNINPSWSPDGKKIAFISDRNGYNDIFLINNDASGITRLMRRKLKSRIDVIHTGGHALSWSPDGKTIAFMGERLQKNYIFLYNLKSKKLKRLHIDMDSVSSPCFSPGGDTIVFTAMKKGISNLYLANINGNDVTQLTDDSYYDNYPVFSHDGKKIIYVSERNLQDDLFILNILSGEKTRLTDTTHDENSPSWSIDDSHVLFISDQNGFFNIYTKSIHDSSESAHPITRIRSGLFTPEYSHDGSRILFVAYEKNEMNLYAGNTDNFTLCKYNEQGSSGNEKTQEKQAIQYTLTEPIPYKFKATTDLIFPVIFLSASSSGTDIYTAFYWQFSEMLGNHQISTLTEYSSNNNWLDYTLTYAYRRWRPQFIINFVGQTDYYYDENDHLIRRKRYGEELIVSYPLDRFNRIESGIANYYQIRRNNKLNTSMPNELENGMILSFVHDDTSWKMLEIQKGKRANLTFYQTKRAWSSDFDFNTYLADIQGFIPIHKSTTLALRLLGRSSEGTDKKSFLLGGRTLLRGYSSSKYTGNKIAIINTELRFVFFDEINYDMWYMFPPFYVKTLLGLLFTDTGYNWNNRSELKDLKVTDLRNSVGIGLKLNTFIAQLIPLTLRTDYAKRTDAGNKSIFYFSTNIDFTF